MNLIRHFKDMARNNAWANRRLLNACMALDPGEFSAPRTGFFPSIRETLVHLWLVDLYYIDALEEGGLGRAVYETEAPRNADGLAFEQEKADARLTAFCDSLSEADLTRTVTTDRGEDGRFEERIDNLLAHLFQHQIHHRGQAHAMLSETSVKPPQLDEFFLDYERAPDAEGPVRF